MEKTDFRLSLRAARVNAGMSQEKAAEMCGVTRFTIKNWEHGITRPTNLQLLGLSQLYNIPLEYIFLPEKISERE